MTRCASWLPMSHVFPSASSGVYPSARANPSETTAASTASDGVSGSNQRPATISNPSTSRASASAYSGV